ncbi:hypothetical protein RUM43_013031 [Polyplax serrata]|uniref:Uncharacterized protein n=1 Tax=Polyplax serrata TaxID=468196 RepID=A0AAN8PCE7_POLSC
MLIKLLLLLCTTGAIPVMAGFFDVFFSGINNSPNLNVTTVRTTTNNCLQLEYRGRKSLRTLKQIIFE